MLSVAVWTAGHRITPHPSRRWAAAPIVCGVLPVLAALLLTGLLPSRGIALAVQSIAVWATLELVARGRIVGVSERPLTGLTLTR